MEWKQENPAEKSVKEDEHTLQNEDKNGLKIKLEQLIDGVDPKFYWKKIKSDKEVSDYVNSFYGETISEKIYNCFHPGDNICSKGNAKKFTSINHGYRNCGPAAKCACTKEQVSNSSISSHAKRTAEQKKETTERTIRTNLKKYGVDNIGKTEKAITKHKEFYSDKNKVEEVTKKLKNTKLELYGSENYNNPDKIRETYREKRNEGYWNAVYPDKNLTILHDKSKLEELYAEYTPHQIAEMANVHVQTVFWYLADHGIREKYKSSEELEVVRFIRNELGVDNIVENSRKILKSGKELDIYLPDYKIAIEYNGVYWHHEDIPHITRSYHHDKFKECAELGIQLITIFSYFWNNKKSVVKKFLGSKLGKSSRKIYARKCSVVELSSADTKEFFDSNHVQGYTPSQTCVGLKSGEEVVAIMTFSRGRIAMGKSNDHIELVRYATSCNVVGGASKLLSHFVKNNEVSKIVSYSDNEWSVGNLYKILGFTLESEVPPSYWYVTPKSDRMYHRFTFAKQKLIKNGADPTLTESQITKSMGLLKIWDCGKKKWVLDLTE